MVLGDLPRSGIGIPIEAEHAVAATELKEKCAESNQVLLRSLREDDWADHLYESTVKDARLGRMSFPVAAAVADLDNILLQPRLGACQLKEDGT